MNLTFYVVVIAFIFGLFYLCSRDSNEEEEMPSTGEDCEMRPPSCTIDVPPDGNHNHHHHQQLQHPQSSQSRTVPDPGNQTGIPSNICPPSYDQVICNEDFYSLNKDPKAPQNTHHQLAQ